jgi:prevent-host-death family protein
MVTHQRSSKNKEEINMITVGIRELRRRASEVIRMVRENGSHVEITLRGKPVAMIIPIDRPSSTEETARAWEHLDRLAAEIGRRWPSGLSAAEAVAEGRE